MPADAAGWAARLGSDQRVQADVDAFERWLASDPAHARTFAGHAALWDGVASLENDPRARAILLGDGSMPLQPSRRKVIAGLSGVAASAVALAGAGVAWRALRESAETRYATAQGEQRHIQLADGSRVTLDTDTLLDIALDGEERRLTLRQGQAFFDVARDPSRPFRVFVGRSEVRALGTAFGVRKDDVTARVVLEHGSVALFRDVKTERVPDAILKPGEQAHLGMPGHVVVGPVDVARSQAWRYGRLMFDATPLARAVAEVNRYGGPHIALADAQVGRLPISGVFHTDQPENFAETVAAALPLRLERPDADTILLSDAR